MSSLRSVATTASVNDTPSTYYVAAGRAAADRTSAPPRYEVNVEVSHDVLIIFVVIATIIVIIAFCSKAVGQCRERRPLAAKQGADFKKQTQLNASAASTTSRTTKLQTLRRRQPNRPRSRREGIMTKDMLR
jgi:hypothetical protein